MLNQAQGDRQILAKQLNISPHQLSYVTNTNAGEGLIFYGNVIIPFVDHFPKDTKLYSIMSTKLEDLAQHDRKISPCPERRARPAGCGRPDLPGPDRPPGQPALSRLSPRLRGARAVFRFSPLHLARRSI